MHFLANWNEDGERRHGVVVGILRVGQDTKFRVEPLDEGPPATLRHGRNDLKLESSEELPEPYDQGELF